MSLLRLDYSGRRLTITLDDPRRQNALSPEMVAEIDRALEDSRARGLASVVIAGANGVFSAGADLKSLSDALANPPAAGEADPLRDQNRGGGQFFARLNAHPVATIALVDGAAVGGGGMGLGSGCKPTSVIGDAARALRASRRTPASASLLRRSRPIWSRGSASVTCGGSR